MIKYGGIHMQGVKKSKDLFNLYYKNGQGITLIAININRSWNSSINK